MPKVNKSKRVKKSRKNNRRTRRYNRGGCATCAEQRGGFGAASMQPIPIRSFYPVNDYSAGPTNPSSVVEGRNYSLVKGGRRRRMKGGNLILGDSKDIYTTFGNTQGAFSGASVYSGKEIAVLPTVSPNTGSKYV